MTDNYSCAEQSPLKGTYPDAALSEFNEAAGSLAVFVSWRQKINENIGLGIGYFKGGTVMPLMTSGSG